MKPVEIEILLRDRLTPGLVKSKSDIEKLFSAIRNALSSTEGRTEKLGGSFKMVKGFISDYSKALHDAEEAQKDYQRAGDKEAYEKERQKVRELKKELVSLTSVKTEVGAAWAKSLKEQNDSAQNLSNSTKNLSDSTKELSDSGEKYSSTLVKMLGGQQSYNAILSALPPEVRQVITGIEGMTKASLAFIATPLGMVLAALATTIALLNTYWHGTIEGEREFAEVSGYTEGVVKSLKDECIDMGKKLSDMFKTPLKSVKEYWKTVYTDFKEGFSSIGGSAKAFAKILSSAMAGDIDGVKAAFDEMAKGLEKGFTKIVKRGTSIGQVANMLAEGEKMVTQWDKKAQRDAQIAADQRSIEEEKIDRLYREEEIEHELAKLRNEMYSGDANAKIKAQAKAQELVNEQYGKQIELAERAEEVARRNYNNHKSNLEDRRAYEQARAEVERLKAAKESAMLPFNRRAASAANTLAKQVAKDAKEQAKMQGNLVFMDAKQQAQSERAARQLALQTQQAYIDGMDEGHEKVMAQLKLQREQELLAIEQQKDDALMAKISQAKQKFDADNSNQGKAFDMSSVAFTDKELAQWDALEEAVEQKIQRLERAEQQKEADAMRTYLENYGTYQQQKLAIAQEYAEKIAKAQTEGERLSLGKERDHKIAGVNAQAIHQTIDWASVFGDFGGMFQEEMKNNIHAIRDYMKTDEFKRMAPTDQAQVVDALNKLKGQAGGSLADVDLKKVGDLTKEFQAAQQAMLVAKEDEEAAYRRLESAQAGYEAAMATGNSTLIGMADQELQSAKSHATGMSEVFQTAQANFTATGNKLKDATQKAVDGITAVVDAIAQIKSGSLAGAYDGIKNLADSLKDSLGKGLGKILSGVSDALGSGTGEIIGACLSLLDLLKDGIGSILADLTDMAFNAVDGVLSDVFSGDIVMKPLKGLADGFKNILSTLTFGGSDSIFGSKKDTTAEAAANIKSLQHSIDNNTSAIERLTQKMDEQGYEGIEESYQQQLELLEKTQKGYQGQLKEALGAWAKHVASSMEHVNDHMSLSDYHKIEQLIGRSVHWRGFFGQVGMNLADMTADELYKIRRDLPDIWEKLTYHAGKGAEDASQYMEKLADTIDELEQLQRNRLESINGISFDSLSDSFLSALSSMEDDAADTAENISKLMSESLVKDMYNDNYRGDVEIWYRELSETLRVEDEKVRNDGLARLKERYQELMDSARADAAAIHHATGYDKAASATSQSGRSGAFTTMSQEQGTKLEGLFVSGQMHWSSMDDKMTDVSEQMGEAGETLRKIESNTGSSAASAAGILEELRKMIRDGLKVK